MYSKTTPMTAVLILLAVSMVLCIGPEGSDATGTANVASIDGTGYETLEQAIDDVEPGQTITMTDDYTMQNRITIRPDKSFTLDLENHTLYASPSLKSSMFVNQGTLTVTADTGGIDCATGTANNLYLFLNSGSLRIDGGTYSGDTIVQSDSGNVTIQSGTFTGDNPAVHLLNISGGTCIISGGKFIGDLPSSQSQFDFLIISGGTFSDRDDAEGYLAENRGIDDLGEMFTILDIRVTVDGAENTYRIRSGESLPSEALPDDIPGYTYMWGDVDMETLGTMAFNASTDIAITKALDAPTVGIDGEDGIPFGGGSVTLSAVVSHELTEGIIFHYTWFEDGAEIVGETNPTLVVSVPGDYSVRVTASDGTLSSSAESTVLTVSMGTAPEHSIPPAFADDDEYVPPIYQGETSPDDDDSTTTLAYAAAAVLSALMAIFLVLEYRRR